MAAERTRTGPKKLTEEQQAAVERIRARHRTPEYRAEEQRVRELARRDFPPATPDPELATLLAAMKSERQRRNVSLTEMQERTGIDRATISKVENGHVPNPTWATLRAYAGALGLRIAAGLAPVSSATTGDVEFRDDGSGTLCLLVPEDDAESLCDYLSARRIVCRQQGPAEASTADPGRTDAPPRVTITLAFGTDRRRIRALTHRWKIQTRGRRHWVAAVPVTES
jgi:transcriptional regulator with XRE-family HTH domain